MKLSGNDRDILLRFIESKGFTQIDVKREILQHFAARVERIVFENPDMLFEEALMHAHDTYGVHGFSAMEASYQKQVVQKYWNDLKVDFRRYFKIMRVAIHAIIFLLLAFITYHITKVGLAEEANYIIIIASLVSFIIILLHHKPVSKNYAIYRSFIGFGFSAFILLLNVHVLEIWCRITDNVLYQNLLFLLTIYPFYVFLRLFTMRLKEIIQIVNHMELKKP